MTVQCPELLRARNREFAIYGEPLGHLIALGVAGPSLIVETTDCWRGYQGTWEIIDGRLYIVALNGLLDSGASASLADFFPENPDRVFAHWYSGALRAIEAGRRPGEVCRILSFDQGQITDDREVREDNGGDDWELPYIGPSSPPMFIEAFSVSSDDTGLSIPVDDIERIERPFDPVGGAPDRPFGYLNPVWRRFKQQLQEGDVIAPFSVGYIWRDGLRDRRVGYVALRNSQPGPYFIAPASTLPEQNPALLPRAVAAEEQQQIMN